MFPPNSDWLRLGANGVTPLMMFDVKGSLVTLSLMIAKVTRHKRQK